MTHTHGDPTCHGSGVSIFHHRIGPAGGAPPCNERVEPRRPRRRVYPASHLGGTGEARSIPGRPTAVIDGRKPVGEPLTPAILKRGYWPFRSAPQGAGGQVVGCGLGVPRRVPARSKSLGAASVRTWTSCCRTAACTRASPKFRTATNGRMSAQRSAISVAPAIDDAVCKLSIGG